MKNGFSTVYLNCFAAPKREAPTEWGANFRHTIDERVGKIVI